MATGLIAPITHNLVGIVNDCQLELNILLHGIIDPEGDDGVVPKLIREIGMSLGCT